MPNLENSAVATGLEKQFSFQSQRKAMPKNAQTTTQTIALVSHASKVMLKILQARLQQYSCTVKFQMFKLDLEKAEEPERSNCQYPVDHQKSKRVSENNLFLLY